MKRRDGTVAVLSKNRGFLDYERSPEPYRPPAERLADWGEINLQTPAFEREELKRQTARCMDCGTPFCQTNTGTQPNAHVRLCSRSVTAPARGVAARGGQAFLGAWLYPLLLCSAARAGRASNRKRRKGMADRQLSLACCTPYLAQAAQSTTSSRSSTAWCSRAAGGTPTTTCAQPTTSQVHSSAPMLRLAPFAPRSFARPPAVRAIGLRLWVGCVRSSGRVAARASAQRPARSLPCCSSPAPRRVPHGLRLL